MTDSKIESSKEGAWLLAQSKSLDNYTGADRLENIAYAGKIGRLYNVLRRGSKGETTIIGANEVASLARLNKIERASRQEGLRVLAEQGRIDLSSDGSVAIIGATSRGVLELTSEVFREAEPTQEEHAVIGLSEQVSSRPLERGEALAFVSDAYELTKGAATGLLDVCRQTALIDQETDRGRTIVFNANLFRDGARAAKAFHLMNALKADEQSFLREAEELLRKKGAVLDTEIERVVGTELFRRLLGIGYLDRMEVNNSSEAVGYMALPDAFQRYGRPFEEDPIDDAKALLASLTYGMTRSGAARGNITMPMALLNALIAGRSVGPVTAIGQDYKELERRGVVNVFPDRYAHSMTLLKKDVGELALTILKGGSASEEAVLIGGSATSFRGPEESRKEVRSREIVEDRPFVTAALDRIRAGG